MSPLVKSGWRFRCCQSSAVSAWRAGVFQTSAVSMALRPAATPQPRTLPLLPIIIPISRRNAAASSGCPAAHLTCQQTLTRGHARRSGRAADQVEADSLRRRFGLDETANRSCCPARAAGRRGLCLTCSPRVGPHFSTYLFRLSALLSQRSIY